jgi:DNA polymerase-3 subunit alpha
MIGPISNEALEQYRQGLLKLTYTDLHIHTEYSLQDGMIRVADYDDPKHVKGEIIVNAERRNTGAVTATDHGNMYGQALLASVAKTFGIKHIPGCEFYIAPGSRFDKNAPKGAEAYRHINAWAKNRSGYANMCTMQKLSYTEGFYYKPRIDKELVDRYGDGIMWSNACVSGTISPLILGGRIEEAQNEFMWYLNRFKDDFYVEYQNHGLDIEDRANEVIVGWANEHGVPIIATTDAHFYKKDDNEAHRALLCIQYGNWLDNPAFNGFGGDGYWLMSEEELLQRYPVEWLNNTQLLVDKVEGGIIQFGEIKPPQFSVPEWFIAATRSEG